jgi:hypothetical protein
MSSPYVLIATTTLFFWVLSSIGLLIYTADTRGTTTHELVIPTGTGTAISGGDNPLELPSTWSYYAGDLLVLDNRDTVLHQIGPWLVAPGSVLAVELQLDLAGSFACSLHPAGEISFDVQPRAYDLGQTLVATLLLGPALGLIIVGVRRVTRAIDDSDE